MASSVSATNVTVPTTAGGTLLLAAGAHRSNVLIRNLDADDTLYIGAQGLTTATGFAILPGESVSLQEATGSIYGLASANTIDTRILAA